MNDTTTPIIDPEVDYEKSIKRQRLAYKPTGSVVFTQIFDYGLYIFFIGIAVDGLFQCIRAHQTNFFSLEISSFVIPWLTSNLFFNNNLVKFQGKSVAKNKEDLLNTLDVFFPSYNFIINNDEMMRSFEPNGNPIWGRIITILFKDDLIYLNITTLGRSDSPTWIHGLFNFIKAKRIVRYYNKYYCSN
ncbi:hypothetical protein [Mucilaginibacter sp.]